jgi:hypothetical protein
LGGKKTPLESTTEGSTLMKTTKKTPLSTQVQSLVPAAGIGKADPVPALSAPAPPKDFVPSKARRGERVQPPATVVKAATGAATELSASVTYVTDFGAHAPDPQTLANNLAFAGAWSAEYTAAEAWFLYVKEQTRLAWLQANPLLDDFGPAFAYARSHNAAIDTQYASTAKVFAGRGEAAVKGAAVRASKRAAAGKTTKKGKPSPTAAPTNGAANGGEPLAVEPPVAVAVAPTNGAARN